MRTARDPGVGFDDAGRRSALRQMRRRATGLLVFMAALFSVVTLVDGEDGAMGYLKAAVEGSLVGGLADWFAVTALFRHPLGLPIPHTAVIAERKDQFGQAIGAFVQENFLHPAVIAERIRSSQAVPRTGAWLADRGHAEEVSRHLSDLAVRLTNAVREEDMEGVLGRVIARKAETLPLAPLAGRALRVMTADGRHQELFETILRALVRVLEENRDSLRARFTDKAPWWLPDRLDRSIFDRLFDGLMGQLTAANEEPDHDLRRQFNEWVTALAERLETSPELRERGERITRELLAHPELRGWSASLWADLKAALRSQAADPGSELRRRLVDGLMAAGSRLAQDQELARRAEHLVESRLQQVAAHFNDEAAGLVTGTIARWDAGETSAKLELLLGRDLQFIRINGTVVGGMAGLAIHALGQAIP
ncbi:MAG: DUF445 domain-containing protein [Acidimicrobiia bacterium]